MANGIRTRTLNISRNDLHTESCRRPYYTGNGRRRHTNDYVAKTNNVRIYIDIYIRRIQCDSRAFGFRENGYTNEK